MHKIRWIVFLLSLVLLVSGCNSGGNDDATILLNEFKSNIPEDIHALQYIELRGSEGKVIKNTYLVVQVSRYAADSRRLPFH